MSAEVASGELYRDMIELSPQLPWVSDPDGNVISMGAKWTDWTGIPIEKALGQGWRARYHPDDLSADVPIVEEAWRTGRPFERRSRLLHHRGGYRWVRVRAYPKLGADGQVIRWYGLVEDIHEQVEAEERLRESEEHYRHTVELHPQLPWTADVKGNIITADERMRMRTGVDPVKARGKDWLALAHPDDRPAVLAAAAHSFATGEPYSVKYRARMASGHYRWVHSQAYPRRNEAGEIIRWYGSNTDIHEHELVQQRLAESEARLRLAQEAAGIGIWDIDLETGLVTLSPRGLEMLNLPADGDGAIGGPKAWSELIHPDDREAGIAVTCHAIRTGEPYDYTFRVSTPDGGVRWTQGLGRTEYGPDGRPLRLIGINLDVTARKEAEAELECAHLELLRLSRLSAMGAMASTLAHELNQPLAAAVQYMSACELLLERGSADQALEACTLAQAEAMRAGDIIRRIRNFATGGQISRRTEDLAKIVERSIAIVKARSDAADVTFIKEIAPEARTVEVDAIQIEQVLTNLMRNAVEAMVEAPERRITFTARRRRDKIDVMIADTGPGLSPEMHQYLFRPFASSKSDGLGLGLPICRTIIEAHGGCLWAEAPGEGGAVIVMSVPAPDSDQAAA